MVAKILFWAQILTHFLLFSRRLFIKIMNNNILEENIVNVLTNCQRIGLNSERLRRARKEKYLFCLYTVQCLCSLQVRARSKYNIWTCESLHAQLKIAQVVTSLLVEQRRNNAVIMAEQCC